MSSVEVHYSLVTKYNMIFQFFYRAIISYYVLNLELLFPNLNFYNAKGGS